MLSLAKRFAVETIWKNSITIRFPLCVSRLGQVLNIYFQVDKLMTPPPYAFQKFSFSIIYRVQISEHAVVKRMPSPIISFSNKFFQAIDFYFQRTQFLPQVTKKSIIKNIDYLLSRLLTLNWKVGFKE